MFRCTSTAADNDPHAGDETPDEDDDAVAAEVDEVDEEDDETRRKREEEEENEGQLLAAVRKDKVSLNDKKEKIDQRAHIHFVLAPPPAAGATQE